MRQKRGKKRAADRVFKFKRADGQAVTIGDAGAHRDLTPAKLAESAEDQEKWAAKAESPFIQESPQLAAFVRARRQIPEWQQSVDVIKADLRKRSIKPDERAFLKERLIHFETVLAETLAMAGEYAEAAKVTPVKELREEYKRIVEAIKRPDDEQCKCDQSNPNILTKEGIVKWVWSKKHRQMMPLIACHHCGEWNVKPETPEISRLRGLRRQAEKMTEGQAPGRARETLERAKHTTLNGMSGTQ